MKRILGSICALLVVVFDARALTQAQQVPPAASIGASGPTVSADAGFLGNLTVLGTCYN